MENTLKQGKHEEKNMGEILSRAEIFFEQHQKAIYYTLIAIVAIVVLIFVSKKYYFEPKNEEVSAKLVWCEQNLARDSFALALNILVVQVYESQKRSCYRCRYLCIQSR